MKDISVVFFGSGPVAAASLRLLAANFTIEAVITKPRPAHHKGPVPVMDLLDSPEAPTRRVITATNKAELSDAVRAERFSSRLGVVIDFGIIISQDVIDAFPLGIINSHFSLLPQWRGADPITFSVLSGQPQTGVSIMRITAGLDEGPLLAVGTYDMQGTETTPSLTDTLIGLSDGLLRDTLPGYVQGDIQPQTQESFAGQLGYPAEPTFSRKLTKEDGILDFTKPAERLEREIRAYAGWPKSRFVLDGKDFTVTAAHVEARQGGKTGTIWLEDKRFGFYCGQNSLAIDRIVPAGKKEMPGEAFLAGYRQLLQS